MLEESERLEAVIRNKQDCLYALMAAYARLGSKTMLEIIEAEKKKDRK
jgi:hypothetical protein